MALQKWTALYWQLTNSGFVYNLLLFSTVKEFFFKSVSIDKVIGTSWSSTFWETADESTVILYQLLTSVQAGMEWEWKHFKIVNFCVEWNRSSTWIGGDESGIKRGPV